MGRFAAAVIPTYNRPEVALDCINSLEGQVHEILVIDNGDTTPMPEDEEKTWPRWDIIRFPEHPGNLSRAWNLGIARWRNYVNISDPWDIVILNDDAIIPPGWVAAVTNRMREQGCIAGCSGPFDHVLREPGLVPLDRRMQGWAFAIAGESDLHADEQFQWWCGDTDLDWQARMSGGMSMVSGFTVINRFADQSTVGIRQEQAGQDVNRFLHKWGMRPF